MYIVGIATGWTTLVRFPTVQDFSLNNLQTGSGTHPASYPMGTGVKRQEREGDHSPPSGGKVMKDGTTRPFPPTF
jgi:hypothetical protein